MTIIDVDVAIAHAHAMAKAAGYTWEVMIGNRKGAHVSLARQCAWYVLNQDLGIGQSSLGRIYGGRDHTTIRAGIQRVGSQIVENVDTRRAVEVFRDIVAGVYVDNGPVIVVRNYVKNTYASPEPTHLGAGRLPLHKREEMVFLAAMRAAHPDRETTAFRRAA